MTSHTPTYKRLNTGQPGVYVRGWATLSGKTNLKPWYAKRYRRAVMQGAGVYLLGLWGVVMGRGKTISRRNTLVSVQSRKYLSTYIGNVFKYFPSLPTLHNRNEGDELGAQDLKALMHLARIVASGIGVLSKQKKLFKRGKMYFCRRYKNKGKRKVEVITRANRLKRMIFYRFKDQKFTDFWLSNNIRYKKLKINKLINILESKDKTPESFKKLLSYLRARADHYRAFLSRIVKARKRPARIPRPIHTRPRPPAAPLAPPIFA